MNAVEQRLELRVRHDAERVIPHSGHDHEVLGRIPQAIDLAWGWLRYQPRSALTRWYEARCARGSSRVRKIGIVAVARKLLIVLWQYLETGCIPEGAVLKP
jgi:hypothetical protein